MTGTLLDDYISEIELAKQLNIGLRTLREWRTKGVGPPITYLGRRPYFHKESTRAWLKSRERKMPRDHNRRRTSPAD
jgi:hypothetical protein